jgi:hypothetical protein
VVARRSAPTTEVGAGSQGRVANKLARILWAMLSRGEAYRAA